MSSLYDELARLTAIPNAYEAWAAYRQAVTDFILTNTAPGGRLLLVGAGACNDFDLRRLTGHAQITLLDRDEAAMRAGLQRQSIDAESVTVLCADLLGVSDEAYRAFADDMVNAARAHARGEKIDVTAHFLSGMDAAMQERTPSPLTAQTELCDSAVCIGVHSQLLVPFARIAGVIARYAPLDTDRVLTQLRGYLPAAVERVNDALFAWAKQTVLIGLETERVGVAGGIDGAAQGMTDIRRFGRPEAETTLLWPFDPAQNKAYRMRLSAYRK
ncbi:MAG: hypothetical protein IJL59_08270 [Clostridia bacterium]|nr:hypothetical protein [Clostridia bacterium]